MQKNDLIISKAKNSKAVYIFAHGAGAPMDHEWMEEMTNNLVSNDITVVRFEFPYMNERRLSEKKKPPNRMPILLDTWREVVSLFKNEKNLFIGGKSMGGRAASLLVDELENVKGLICLGFPFHAPGKDPKDRIVHLEGLKSRTLIIQGERDSMGNLEEVKTYPLSKKISVKWLEDGDHGLKPRKKSGFTLEEHLKNAAKIASKYMITGKI